MRARNMPVTGAQAYHIAKKKSVQMRGKLSPLIGARKRWRLKNDSM